MVAKTPWTCLKRWAYSEKGWVVGGGSGGGVGGGV